MRKSADRKCRDVPAAVPRQVSTSASIQQLQKVQNMRDLAEVCSGIAPGILKTQRSPQLTKPCPNKRRFECCYKAAALLNIGRILRSACPTSANQQDVDIIRQKLKITHLVSFLCCALSPICCHVMRVSHCHKHISTHFAIEQVLTHTVYAKQQMQDSRIVSFS